MTVHFKTQNVEKVWIAEQKAEQETKKLAELQKQILEERQIQELRQLQVAHGQQVKTVDSTLDWMYQGPAGHDALVKQQTTEEYLLGNLFLILLFPIVYRMSRNGRTNMEQRLLLCYLGKIYKPKDGDSQTDVHRVGT